MVTSHPLPEGFTEIEVFAIGTALLVEGKLSLGPQQQQKKKSRFLPLLFLEWWMGTEANSSTCNVLTQTCAGYCVCIISASGGLPAVCSEDPFCMHSFTVEGKYLPLRFLIKNLGR